MKKFFADLHVHTVLSPCGELEMSPVKIIQEAKRKNINILGVSDHNSTLHSRLMMELGNENGIFVLPGAEVNTSEEIHCLTFFENIDNADEFQKFLESRMSPFRNDPDRFGDQVVVNRDEEIVTEIDSLLISALTADIYDVAAEVSRLNGLLIPAHIDRPYNSLLSQLGFIPSDLSFDALEVSYRSDIKQFLKDHSELNGKALVTNSDAHRLCDLGRATTVFEIESPEFAEIRMALMNENGRKIGLQ